MPVKAPLPGIIALIGVLLGLGGWTGYRIYSATTAREAVAQRRKADAVQSAALAKAPLRVAVTSGAPLSWVPRVELEGSLQPQQAAKLGFKVGGRLSRVQVALGQSVAAGAVLAVLDASEAQAHSAAAAAQVRAAEAQLLLSQDNETRTQALVQSGSFSEASGVQVIQQRALAQAQLDAARAQLALSRAGLAGHTLSAPFAGTITKLPEGIGEVVAPGNVLFELVDTRRLKLHTTVGEHDANLLSPGSPIEVATETGTVAGRVTAVLGTVDTRTRRVPVEALFESPGSLRAGAFVRGSVTAQHPIEVLKLPHSVLRPGSQDEVFVVGPERQLEARYVVYAVAPDGALLVRRGLSRSDQVVIAPKAESKAFDRVELEPARSGNPE
jgi:RND family efflux transporter MFP subunit